jgi:hypothetical protein
MFFVKPVLFDLQSQAEIEKAGGLCVGLPAT